MNDYKELIKELKAEFNECDKLIGKKVHLNLSDAPIKKYEILAEDCCGEMVGIMQTISCAVDAIEQLVKERDMLRDALEAAHEDRRKAEAKAAKCELEVMCLKEDLADMKLERDAAIADIKTLFSTFADICSFCKNDSRNENGDVCKKCVSTDLLEFWEWRGVQE